MSQLSHGQQIVLDHHLAIYPEDVSFSEICKMLEENNEEVTVSDAFEDINIESLIYHMTDLSNDIDKVIVDSHKVPENIKGA